MNKWISVKDKLPNEGDNVVVWWSGENGSDWYGDVYYMNGLFRTFDHHYGEYDEFTQVTHWMIPECPEVSIEDLE